VPAASTPKAPSELLTSGLASKAACSQRRAVSIASSTVNAQGWYKSRSGQSLAIKAKSARPAQSSSAVKRAILSAASTVSRKACAEKSEVLA
jgi:hypothetical protein